MRVLRGDEERVCANREGRVNDSRDLCEAAPARDGPMALTLLRSFDKRWTGRLEPLVVCGTCWSELLTKGGGG